MSNFFNIIENLVKDLNKTNSNNDKKKVLKNYDSEIIRKFFVYVYSPYKQYYVTSKNLRKKINLIKDVDKDLTLFELLDKLDNREITGHEAISTINGFIENHKNYANLIYKIIDRNLETRANAKLINAVYDDVIPEFSVQLANKFDDYKEKINFENQDWIASRKMDGLRLLAIPFKNGYRLFSRKGKEFESLNVLKSSLDSLFNEWKNYVIDGEVCLVDENGKEDFSSIMREIRRKNHTISNPRLKVFDLIPVEDFNEKYGKTVFSERIKLLQAFNSDVENNSNIDVLEQTSLKSEEGLKEMMQLASDNNWEGLILHNGRSPYEGKRSKNLLKIKSFFENEYVVKNVIFGDFRLIKNGKEVTENLLSAVEIDHKGYTVKVGSGFTLDEREYYRNNPNELIGKVITVIYFEESHDREGNISLRFPVCKAIHGEKREL